MGDRDLGRFPAAHADRRRIPDPRRWLCDPRPMGHLPHRARLDGTAGSIAPCELRRFGAIPPLHVRLTAHPSRAVRAVDDDERDAVKRARCICPTHR